MANVPIGRRDEALRLLGLKYPVEHYEIVTAYRRLARQHHPDLGGDPEVFRSLTVAREVLLADARGEPGTGARSTAGRSVAGRQRTSRRLLRGLRRRLDRKGGARRQLD